MATNLEGFKRQIHGGLLMILSQLGESMLLSTNYWKPWVWGSDQEDVVIRFCLLVSHRHLADNCENRVLD